jgi:hypothetical protein
MSKKRKIFKLWLHVEEITKDKKGNDIKFKNLDYQFLPVQVCECRKKSRILRKMTSIEHHGAAIALLEKILGDTVVETPYDLDIYRLLKKIGRDPSWPSPLC